MSLAAELRPAQLQTQRPAAVSLGCLLTCLEPDTVRIVSAPEGLDGAVCSVPLWDLAWSAPPAAEPRALVMVTASPGPGINRRLVGLVQQLADADVAGLVVRRRDLDAEWLSVAAAAHLTVLAVPAQRDWAQVRAALLTALALGSDADLDAPASVLDLPGLVEVLAEEARGTVLVTDHRLRVLAHHVTDTIEDAVRDWILTRSPSAELRDRLPARGRVLGLRRDHDLLSVPGCTVAVIRAGADVRGAVWVLDGDRIDPSLLRVAARRAAALMTVNPPRRDAAQRLRADLLHCALTGSRTAGQLAAELGIDHPVRLLGFRLDAHRAGALAGLVEVHVQARAPHAAVTCIGDHVYLFGPAEIDAANLAANLRRGSRDTGGQLRCAVSDPLCGHEDLVQARADLDRLIGLPDVPAVAAVAEHYSRLVLAELAELAAEHRTLQRGAIAQLAGIDGEQQTSYLPSLRAWFGTGLDLQRAADSLYVHRNTLRYRLERIRTLTGLELADPVQRLVADLQLRLHDAEPVAKEHRP